jgi:hypothetical protein
MALITFNIKQRIPHTKPFVSFGRTGLILLNKTAEKLMKLKAGDCIEFAQDDTNAEDWFIRKCNKSSYVLRHNTDKSLVCSGQDVCKQIKSATLFQAQNTVQYTLSETIGDEGWVAIITSKYKQI